MKNTFSDALIGGPATAATPGQLSVELRLPWYRTLPLSVVELAELTLDGQPLPLDGAHLQLEGQPYPLASLGERTDVQWFVQDSAFLHLPVPGLDPAIPHEVTLLMKLYPPYIPMLTWVTRGTKTLEAA